MMRSRLSGERQLWCVCELAHREAACHSYSDLPPAVDVSGSLPSTAMSSLGDERASPPPWSPPSGRLYGGRTGLPSSRPSSRGTSRPTSRASSRPKSRGSALGSTSDALRHQERLAEPLHPRTSPIQVGAPSPRVAAPSPRASPRVTASSTRPQFPATLPLPSSGPGSGGRLGAVHSKGAGATAPIAAPFLSALGLQRGGAASPSGSGSPSSPASAGRKYWPETVFAPDMFGVKPRDAEWDVTYRALARMRNEQARAQHEERMGRIYSHS